MGIVAGEALGQGTAIPTPRRRVVVKMKAGTITPPPGVRSLEAHVLGESWLTEVGSRAQLRLQPYFHAPAAGGVLGVRGAGLTAADPYSRFMAIECPNPASAAEVVQQVRRSPDVERAYVEAGPVPPPVAPSNNPRFQQQGYLRAAHEGIGVQAIWDLGCDGSGVNLVDLERGWTLQHEDLTCRAIPLISGVNRDFRGHGTAVLSVIASCDNKKGGIGIAPGAHCRVISQWRSDDDNDYRTADAIADAASRMTAGDVLLLEAQTRYATANDVVPVEVEEAVFVAIRAAVDQGIIVVEAGGNGAIDLDLFADELGHHVLNRNSPDFRDSGAIVVGAATASDPHTPSSFTNFGSRIDCFAWGESIDSAGNGGEGNDPTTYTTDFGGTSGASAILAGVAALVQSLQRRLGGAALTPGEMRSVLSAATNTPSNDPAADRIGVMPDLGAIATALQAQPAPAAVNHL